MISKIKNRMASEQGFTLIELLVVIIILGILVAIAVPSYLGFRGKAEIAAAKANVRSAIPAAESFYNDTSLGAGLGNGSYQGISKAQLQTQAPGVSNNVRAGTTAATPWAKYCIQDQEGSAIWSYEGGTGGAATLVSGACLAATYATMA